MLLSFMKEINMKSILNRDKLRKSLKQVLSFLLCGDVYDTPLMDRWSLKKNCLWLLDG